MLNIIEKIFEFNIVPNVPVLKNDGKLKIYDARFIKEFTIECTSLNEMNHLYMQDFVIHFSDSLDMMRPPKIIRQPIASVAVEGRRATFDVVVEDISRINYQWQTDKGTEEWYDIPEAHFSEFDVVVSNDMNGWRYRVIITNEMNVVSISDVSILSVWPSELINLESNRIPKMYVGINGIARRVSEVRLNRE